MRATFLCLVFLLVVPNIDAAPAPATGGKAKERLETLKKRLPKVLETWVKARNVFAPENYVPVLRRVRLIGDGKAKVVVHFHYCDQDGKARETASYMVIVYLSYYDGLWTAVRFQWDDSKLDKRSVDETHFLMDAIDEAAEK